MSGALTIREALWNDEDDEANQVAETADPTAPRASNAQAEG